MICDDVQPELEAYAQEELSPEARAQITAHLTDCDDCRAALTWVGGLADALRNAAPEPKVEVDPDAVTAAVLGDAPTAVPRPRRRRASGRTARPGSSRVLALAAVVLVAGLLALSLRAPADRDTAQPPTPSPRPLPASTRTARPTPAPTRTPEPPRPTPTPTAVTPSPSPTPTASPVVRPSPSPSPTLTPTPTPAPTSVARQAGVAIARVSLRLGKPEVQRHGQSTWTPLALNGIVRTGDVVRAKRGVVGLSFPSGDPARASVDGRAQLALYRGQVTVGPLQSKATARLDRGECLVFTQQALAIQVGKASVGVEGTAELRLKSSGKAGQIDVHEGVVELVTPGGRTRFAAGRRVKLQLRRDGVDGRDRRFKVKTPAWWRRIQRGLIARASYLLDVRRFDPSEYEELIGRRASGRAVLIGDLQGGAPTIRFGRSTPRGGLWTYRGGQRVRIRVRVSKPARIRLQLTNLTAKDNFHATSDPVRANTWVDLAYQPHLLADNAGQGRRVSPGDLIGYLAIQAQAKSPVTLELQRVLVAD